MLLNGPGKTGSKKMNFSERECTDKAFLLKNINAS